MTLYQNDPQRTGAYDFPALRGPVEVWWQAEAGPISIGSPLYADGVLYVGTRTGRLRAFDGETGDELWDIAGLGDYLSPIAIAGDKVIVSSSDQDVTAFNLEDQSQAWSFATDGIAWNAPLVIDGGWTEWYNGDG